MEDEIKDAEIVEETPAEEIVEDETVEIPEGDIVPEGKDINPKVVEEEIKQDEVQSE